MNVWDYLIIAAVAVAAFFAIRAVVKRKGKGQCSCGCEGCTGGINCRGCTVSGSAETAKTEKEASSDDRA